VSCFRTILNSQDLSPDVLTLITSSWAEGTHKQYEPHIRKWINYCTEKGVNPINPPIHAGANFLANLFKSSTSGYSSINTARSALSAIITPVNGVTFGKHPIIKRLLRGVFRERPALPRYTTTYDVEVVLQYLKSLGDELTLCNLTLRLATLMCILSGQRSQTLMSLSIKSMHIDKEKCVFFVNKILKQTRPGRHQAPLEFLAFPSDPSICVVKNLQDYLVATSEKRQCDQIFISYSKPFHGVKSCTIARWICNVLQRSGIDITLFRAHSVRGAATSKGAITGLSLSDISKAAGWSGTSTFSKHYRKPVLKNFGEHILTNL